MTAAAPAAPALLARLDELHPVEFRPVWDGRYTWTGPASDARRLVHGVNARWGNIGEIALVSVSWRISARNGELALGRENQALRRPLWIPPGVTVEVVCTLERVQRGAWLQLWLQTDLARPGRP